MNPLMPLSRNWEICQNPVVSVIVCNHHCSEIASLWAPARLKLEKKLISTKKLTLTNMIDICRAAEATAIRIQTMNMYASSPREVHRVQPASRSKPPLRSKASLFFPNKHQNRQPAERMECKFCGLHHELVKSKSPAYEKTCSKCGECIHFAAKCLQQSKGVNLLVQEESSDSELRTRNDTCSAWPAQGRANICWTICPW